ncbi:MAG: S16 family serine protease [Acidimicrobiales bacterium]
MADEDNTIHETLSSADPREESAAESMLESAVLHDESGEPESKKHRKWVFLGSLAIVVGIGLGIASMVSVPYTAFTLGSINPTEDVVEITGAEVFPSEGEVFYATVRLNRLSALEWVFIRLEPAVDIRPTEQVFGSQSTEESRQCNAQMMVTSQSTANIVALTYLGYDVFEPTGVTVQGVRDESAADNILECGDVILEADNSSTTTTNTLRDAVIAREPGDVIDLVIERDGVQQTIQLPLGTDSSGQALLGVSIGTRLSENDLPIDIDLTLEGVGGPSAGLAFTLSFVDLLTEGELTGGADVAATGTISLDGRVGPIGGVRQKVAAAKRSGADLMLIPASLSASEIEIAFAEAGDNFRVELVETLDDAIRILTSVGGNGDELVGPNGPVNADL